MTLTFSQFAAGTRLSIRTVQWLAQRSGYASIAHSGQRYELIQQGTYPNGSPLYLVVVPDDDRKKVHLNDQQRTAALSMLNALFARTPNSADAISKVAKQFGVSYHSVYRLWKNPDKAMRKQRTDKGAEKKIIPVAAMDFFESAYVQNANRGNVSLAHKLTSREYPGFGLPIRYFKKRVPELERLRLAFHQQAQFEQKYTPRVRRDLWAEFEFLEQVSLDGWTVPDRVLKSSGLEELTKQKFKFNGKDVSMVCVMAFDSKTRTPLAWGAFEKSVTADDVLSVLLEVVYNWGIPSTWLLDNGSEFTNEPVQRFLRGLYTTREHDDRHRIIFSEPYQPTGKGSHERQHRIFKDEFCAFSRSYSPNARESRKPTRQLSYVKPTHTLAEWTEKFQAYLDGYYREAQRVSWMNPLYRPHDEQNADRPRTLNEAFERAYKTFMPNKCEPMKLAFLYAKKFRSHMKHGAFPTPAAISPRKYVYLPDGEGVPDGRYGKTFEIVVNPTNLFQAWICDLNGTLVCDAWDPRGKDAVERPTKEVAAQLRKKRNRETKLAKELARTIAERENIEDAMRGKGSARENVDSRQIEQSIYKAVELQTPQQEELDEDYLALAVEIYSQPSSEDRNE